jgi:hypothetical protein
LSKRVLILTYYWPPSGGSGVQRWLKTVKYIRSYGWEPVVYTSEGGEAPVIDDSLQKDVPEGIEVIKTPIWEPYSIYKKMIGQKKSERINTGFLTESARPKLAEKISVWIRGNFFIPDARCYWIKPSVKYLTAYLQKNPVDAIVSTGPPHSMHLIALGLKQKLDIPWLADFRDPWTNIDFYDQLMLSKRADRKHRRLERAVLLTANKVVTVSWSWAEDFKKIANRPVEVVTNGFDEDDFKGEIPELYKGFLFHHIGAMNKDRNPHIFWKVLAELCGKISGFKDHLKIKLTGKNDISVLNSIRAHGLEDNTEYIDHITHREVVASLRKSPMLLLPLNDTPNIMGIIPGKLFEYLAARRPIFAIGNIGGDTAKIIHEVKAGIMVDFKNEDATRSAILKFYEQYKADNLKLESELLIDKYSRKNCCKQLAGLLDTISKTSSLSGVT